MIKEVVIDFDDTLCLTEENCFELENEVLKRLGREPQDRQVHIATWGQPVFEAIATRSPGVDTAAFREAFRPVIAEFIASGRLDSIADENYAALDMLIEQGYKVVILTSRTHDELEHLLAPDHLLATRVEAFYYKDNTQFHRPDPRVFDELLKERDLKPTEIVYVGDSVSDAEASNRAGVGFILCLEGGLRIEQDFAQHQVLAAIQKFADLPGVVASLG